MAAIATGETIWVVEGEKDAETMVSLDLSGTNGANTWNSAQGESQCGAVATNGVGAIAVSQGMAEGVGPLGPTPSGGTNYLFAGQALGTVTTLDCSPSALARMRNFELPETEALKEPLDLTTAVPLSFQARHFCFWLL